MGDLHGVGHVPAGLLDAADVGVAAEALHVLRGDGAACPAGDIVENAGDLHRVGHGGKVAEDALRIALVVVGGDEQQAAGPQRLRPQALLQHGLGGVGAGAGDDGNPAGGGLNDAAQNRVVLLVGHGGALPGGAQGKNGVGFVRNVPLRQLPQLLKVHRSVGVEGGHQGHNGALQVADVHGSIPPKKNSGTICGGRRFGI